MKFNGLTKVGREYLAKVTANKTPITFAKIKFGNGNLDEKDNPMTFTDIKSIKAEKSILKIEQHDDAVKIITQLDNVKLEQGYYPRETGIYVSDGDSEILYYYINDGEETSYLPPESNGPVRFDIAVNLIATSESVLTVRNDGKDLYITKDYFDNELNKKENVIEKKSAFNKDFGIEAGTVLEGNKYPIIENKFKGIVGNEINATFIQDSGQKTKGKFYLDRNTGKLYRCVNNTNSTTNSTDNFQDISLDTVS
ncbi:MULTISPECIES: phage tail protein, partial [unclassified Fusobacterium]|uniref:phage tail protein n=3 Tax=Fusobacterium TaxID=848 RepID=UPI001B8BBF10